MGFCGNWGCQFASHIIVLVFSKRFCVIVSASAISNSDLEGVPSTPTSYPLKLRWAIGVGVPKMVGSAPTANTNLGAVAKPFQTHELPHVAFTRLLL